MIIPHFWAEARLQTKEPKRQVTVRRLGWSDLSQAEAQAMADQRTQDAMQRILRGESLHRRENKAPYDVAEGVPIREEVVARHGKAAITRNSYGSLCLNVENVFFADVDSRWTPSLHFPLSGCLLLIVSGIAVGLLTKSVIIGLTMGLGLPWLGYRIVASINRSRRSAEEPKAKEQALLGIRDFCTARPDWHLRVYETPAGYRLLAMHALFDPNSETSKSALEALNSDRLFAQLCAIQGCFRARVSPKYWRMDFKPPHTFPKAKWPFSPHEAGLRQRWVEAYEKRSIHYASCHFIEALGNTATIHPDAEAVREVHDHYCQALSQLRLA
jgi:hypothetical protein